MDKILTVTLNPAIDKTLEISNFTLDSVNRVKDTQTSVGGKGINVATALSGKYIVDSTGFLGKEEASLFQEHLTRYNIGDKFIYVNGRTREGLKITDPENLTTTDINFPGFMITQDELHLFIENFKKIIADYKYLILSGSLPDGIPKDIYSKLATEAKKHDIFVALDSSGDTLLKGIKSNKIDLISPNLDELREIFDFDDEQFHSTIKSIVKKVDYVNVTLGQDGAKLFTKNEIYNASALNIVVKSSVGAGDAYLAGFISGLIESLPTELVLKTAISWSASKLAHIGPGLSEKFPPDEYMDQILINKKAAS